MKNSKILILGGLLLAGVGYFLYSKKKSSLLSTPSTVNSNVASSTVANPIVTPVVTPVVTPKPIVDTYIAPPKPIIETIVLPVIAPIKKYYDYRYGKAFSGCTIQWIKKDGSTGTQFVPQGEMATVYQALENSGSGCGAWTKI